MHNDEMINQAPLFVPDEWLNSSQEIINTAKSLGASATIVAAKLSKGLVVSSRLGKLETVEHHQAKNLEITVYFGQRNASVSINDLRLQTIHNAVQAACHIARFTQDDVCAGLAEPNLLAYNYQPMQLLFPWTISVAAAAELITTCEQEALALDPRLVNSDGASLSTYEHWYFLANSLDFAGYYGATYHSMGVALMVQEQHKMQRDHSYTAGLDPTDLWAPQVLAAEVARKTVARLQARRIPTQKAPVIFINEEARRLLKLLVAAISGANLFRKSSFLLDALGQAVLPANCSLREEPALYKGVGAAPFDDDGLLTRNNVFIDQGILTQYALSVYSARKLGMAPTGNAGGVHNLILDAPLVSFAELLRQLNTGLLITETLGSGTNLVTGDYSHGCFGFWVEQGVIVHPVEEITIAGNLREMLANIVAVGDDVDVRTNIRTGSILLAEMTIGGA